MLLLCFAMGNLHPRLKSGERNRNSLIEAVAGFPVDGIELTFATRYDLQSTKLSRKSIDFLKSDHCKHVSLHAPFGKRSLGLRKNIKKIRRLYDKLELDFIICHPYSFPEGSTIKDMPLLLENVPYVSFDEFQDVYEKQANKGQCDGVCLDIGHAHLVSPEELEKYFIAYKSTIKEIHFNISNGNTDHLLFKEASPEFLDSISIIKSLDVPIIMETDFFDNTNEEIINEINSIRNWLQSSGK
ncbi:MAG: hypothetical protein ACFFD4_27610 [Candidatus Odinarchaeota archaeon]